MVMMDRVGARGVMPGGLDLDDDYGNKKAGGR